VQLAEETASVGHPVKAVLAGEGWRCVAHRTAPKRWLFPKTGRNRSIYSLPMWLWALRRTGFDRAEQILRERPGLRCGDFQGAGFGARRCREGPSLPGQIVPVPEWIEKVRSPLAPGQFEPPGAIVEDVAKSPIFRELPFFACLARRGSAYGAGDAVARPSRRAGRSAVHPLFGADLSKHWGSVAD
jgi:hypothetical protein